MRCWPLRAAMTNRPSGSWSPRYVVCVWSFGGKGVTRIGRPTELDVMTFPSPPPAKLDPRNTQRGVPVDWCQKGGGGQTALHLAAFAANVEAVQALLELGASINLPNDISGATPLHLAGACLEMDRAYLLSDATDQTTITR